MKELVKGQKIRIDNHNRGTGAVGYYDDPANDIHLDKTVYDGKKNGEYQIRVPLNSNRPVTVNREEDERIPGRLLMEIQNAFGDSDKKRRFVDEMREVLKGYPIRDKNNVNVDKVQEAMRRISDAFELGWNEGPVLNYVHPTMTQGLTFITLLMRGDDIYYLSINYKRIVVADYSKIPPRYVKEWEELGDPRISKQNNDEKRKRD